MAPTLTERPRPVSAEAVFEQVKSAYGAHCCHHLRLNSRRPEHWEPHQPDPWASFVLRRPANPVRKPDSFLASSAPTGPHVTI